MFELNGDIKIRNRDVMGKFLKKFCNKIKKLKINYKNIQSNELFLIGYMINLYCWQNLTELEFLHCENGELNGLFWPFKRVKKLTISGMLNKLQSNNLYFHQLFPAVEILDLNLWGDYTQRDLKQTFQHLEHIKITKYQKYQYLNPIGIVEILKSNPQINRLTLQEPSNMILKIIRENILKLKSLELSYLIDSIEFNAFSRIGNGTIRMPNIENLKIISTSNQLPEYFADYSFDDLQNFELHSFTNIEEWIKIILNHSKLQKIHLTNGKMTDEYFHSLIGQLPNLIEFNASCSLNVQTSSLFKFIKTNKNLNKIHLQIPNKIYDKLLKKLGRKWQKTNRSCDEDTILSTWLSIER